MFDVFGSRDGASTGTPVAGIGARRRRWKPMSRHGKVSQLAGLGPILPLCSRAVVSAARQTTLQLSAIEEVMRLVQDFFGRIFNYGRIEVRGTGLDDLELPALGNPVQKKCCSKRLARAPLRRLRPSTPVRLQKLSWFISG